MRSLLIAALIFHLGGNGGSGPVPNSVVAANLTAANNSLCTAISPFYAEIGNSSGMLWSTSVGTGAPSRTTGLGVDSASKFIYSYYIWKIRGSLSSYTSADIAALNQTDGNINVGENGSGSSCPSSLSPRTPAQCLTQSPGPNGQPSQNYGATVTNQGSGTQGTPGTSAVGIFFYQGGHDEVHAVNHSPLANYTDSQIALAVNAQIGTTVTYLQPLLPGGVYATTANYATMLQNMLLDSGYLTTILKTTDTVCTDPGGNYSAQTVGGLTPGPSSCNAQYSPVAPAKWQYGLGFWIESDPSLNNDGAYSSPGSAGYYPWISHSQLFYGVLARSAGAGQGYNSAQCGELIRAAYCTGFQQTGSTPASCVL